MTQREGILRWPTWIGVVVDDLEAQRTFWADVLGVPEDHAGPGFAHFIMPTGQIFEVIERSELSEYDRRRFQVGFEVDDIQAARDELIRRGITPISEIMGDDSPDPWAYFRDLEGNVFEIKQRKPRLPNGGVEPPSGVTARGSPLSVSGHADERMGASRVAEVLLSLRREGHQPRFATTGRDVNAGQRMGPLVVGPTSHEFITLLDAAQARHIDGEGLGGDPLRAMRPDGHRDRAIAEVQPHAVTDESQPAAGETDSSLADVLGSDEHEVAALLDHVTVSSIAHQTA